MCFLTSWGRRHFISCPTKRWARSSALAVPLLKARSRVIVSPRKSAVLTASILANSLSSCLHGIASANHQQFVCLYVSYAKCLQKDTAIKRVSSTTHLLRHIFALFACAVANGLYATVFATGRKRRLRRHFACYGSSGKPFSRRHLAIYSLWSVSFTR